jgi:hypothetical protein
MSAPTYAAGRSDHCMPTAPPAINSPDAKSHSALASRTFTGPSIHHQSPDGIGLDLPPKWKDQYTTTPETAARASADIARRAGR